MIGAGLIGAVLIGAPAADGRTISLEVSIDSAHAYTRSVDLSSTHLIEIESDIGSRMLVTFDGAYDIDSGLLSGVVVSGEWIIQSAHLHGVESTIDSRMMQPVDGEWLIDCGLPAGSLVTREWSIESPHQYSLEVIATSRHLIAVDREWSIDSRLLSPTERTWIIDSGMTDDSLRSMELSIWSRLLDTDPRLIDDVVVLQVGGVVVPFESAAIQQEEGEPVHSCRLTLATPEAFAALPIDTDFVLTINGEAWSFFVDSRSIARSISPEGTPQAQYQIGGLAPAARLSAPRADTISASWPDPIMASEAVEEIVGTVTWGMVDWLIAANRLGFDGSPPLECARKIVEAAGGMLESYPDGTLYARQRYKATMPELYFSNPDITISEIYATNETEGARDPANSVRVYDLAITYSDRIEIEDIDALRKVARVYPSPWRANIGLTCSDSRVSISPRSQGSGGRLQLISEEVVEIKGGAGSLRYPPIRIDNVEWLRESLGGIAWEFAVSDIHTSIPGYSLARIDYATRAFEFDISGPAGSLSLLRVVDYG